MQPAPPSLDQSFTSDAHDEPLLKDLLEQHSSRLYRFIFRHIGNSTEAEDLTQQTFVEAVQAYRSYRGEAQLSTWLYGIALNLVRNYLSRSPDKRYEFLGEETLDTEACSAPSPETQAENNQTIIALNDALGELPPQMRELLLLVATEDISYEEAATLLMVPIGTVRSRLSRARKILKEKLRLRGVTD